MGLHRGNLGVSPLIQYNLMIILRIYTICAIMFSTIYSKDVIVSGTIIDAETLSPIEKVNITVDNFEIGASSNKTGYFELPNLIDGEYYLKLSHIGYEPKTLLIKVPLVDNLVCTLKSSIKLYQPIMVSGLQLERNLENSPIITDIITSNEIERYSATSVLEVLEKTIPNIKIMNDPHGTNMSIQGLDSKYFLFLLNGNRMAGETTGNIDFSRLNTMNIERIELLNGGASTLYGSGAIGGVVNIITKDNKSLFDIRIKTKRYSENNDKQNWISFGFGDIRHKINSQTNITSKSSHGYSLDGNVIQNIYNDISLNQNFVIKPIKNLEIDISGTYYSHDTEDYNYNNKRRDKYYDNQLILNCEYGNITDYLYQLTWNKDIYEKYTLFEALNDEERIRSSHNLDFLNLTFYKPFNLSNSYSVGYEYYIERFYSPTDLSYNPFAGYLGSDSIRSSIINSYFIQMVYNFNKINLIGGIRYDNNQSFYDHIGPHLSLLYNNKKYKIRINASHNFKSPTLKELYMEWDHLGMFYVKGNRNLIPEKSNYFSTSIEKINNDSNIKIKTFIQKLKNMIISVEELDLNQMIYRNYKSVLIRGFDISINKRKKYMSFHSNLSLLSPEDLNNNYQLEGTNKVSLSSNIAFYLFDFTSSINVNYKFNSETYFSSGTIPSYHVVNTPIIYEFLPNIKLSIGIDNLINTTSLDNRMTIYPDTRYYFMFNFNKH